MKTQSTRKTMYATTDNEDGLTPMFTVTEDKGPWFVKAVITGFPDKKALEAGLGWYLGQYMPEGYQTKIIAQSDSEIVLTRYASCD